MKKIILIILFIIFAGAQNLVPLHAQEQQYDAAVLKSDINIKIFGKYGLWEHEGAEDVLKILGLKYQVISDAELESLPLKYKIIIIPNARCLSAKGADNLRQYLKDGGKIFACYQTGYRDEENKYKGNVNNFHISDILGADFYSWNNKPPKCEYLKFNDEIFSFKDKYVQLARNTAMFIKPHKDTKILAYFLNANKTDYSNIKDLSAAIIINKDANVIYSGENLFAPENSSSAQVKHIIASLINMLSPELINENNSDIDSAKISYFLPFKPDAPICPQGQIVRILLGDNYEKICVSANNGLVIKEESDTGGILAEAKHGELIYIEPVFVYNKAPYIAVYNQNKELIAATVLDIYIKPKDAEKIINLVKLNPNDTHSLKAFRNSLKIKQNKNNLICYNYLTIEEYIAGVVPNEMPYYYPAESLAAMAVVARTFARANINRHFKEGYDICPTVHCQVYEGVMSETNETNNAVSRTAGEYITYNGGYAYATFHASCGGSLEDVENVWPAHKPAVYLRASFDEPNENKNIDLSIEENFKNFINNPPDSFCKNVPRYRWKEKYTKEELEKALKESLPVILGNENIYLGKLIDIQIIDRTKHGRTQALKIIGSADSYIIYQDSIRWITSGGNLGTGGLQSTLFYIEKNDNSFIFNGGGWGHGVGMCQSGAQGMAKAGYDYKSIIKHYYQGVEITGE